MSLFPSLYHGLRALAKSPGFTLVAIMTLAIGIGANTAMFSIMSKLLLRPLPYPDAERLVFVRDIQPQLRDLPGSYPEFLDWRGIDDGFLRVTMGARALDLLLLVFRSGGKLVLLGIAFGVAGSFAVTRFLSSLLFGVTATDPSVTAIVAAVLASVAALALYLPARRAARVDPMVAIRHS